MGAPSALIALAIALCSLVTAQDTPDFGTMKRWVDVAAASNLSLHLAGGAMSLMDFAVGPTGEPLVAFADERAGGKLSMARLTSDGQWEYLGTELSEGPVQSLSLTVSPSGIPSVAHYLKTSDTPPAFEGRVVQLAGYPNLPVTVSRFSFGRFNSIGVALAWGPQDQPWIAFEANRGRVRILAQSAGGVLTTMAPPFGSFSAGGWANAMSMAMDPNGTAWLAFVNTFRRLDLAFLNSSAWEWQFRPFGNMSAGRADGVSLAFDAAGYPCVSYIDTPLATGFDTAQLYPTVVCLTSLDGGTGTAVTLRGTDPSDATRGKVALQTALARNPATGELVLAFESVDSQGIRTEVVSWTGPVTGWQPVGSFVGGQSASVPMLSRLAFDGNGTLFLALSDHVDMQRLAVLRLDDVPAPSPPS